MRRTIIDNNSSYTFDAVLNYLAGYTTALHNKIEVTQTEGVYYEDVFTEKFIKITITDTK